MPKPTRKREWEDEYTLLCERCGYILEGLDTSDPCPECAKPIAESLPDRRIGTPWQQNPGFVSMVKTWWMTLRHPLHTLDVMRFDDQAECFPLIYSLIYTALICSVLMVIPMLFSFLSLLGLALIFLLLSCAIIALFYALSGVEALGLQIVGKSRGLRIGPHVAWAIVGHGAVGWLFTGLIWVGGFQLYQLIMYLNPTHSNFELRMQVSSLSKQILYPSFIIGIVIGLFVFELFAYLGLRRCKYANRVRPASNLDKKQDPSPGLAAESVESNESE